MGIRSILFLVLQAVDYDIRVHHHDLHDDYPLTIYEKAQSSAQKERKTVTLNSIIIEDCTEITNTSKE